MSSLKDFNVNDLDFENMGSWPTPVKIITGVIVFVLVLLLGYQLVVSEDEAQLEREILNERKHKQDFETKQARAVHLEAYKNQMVMIQASFEALLKQLPQNSQVPSLVDEISYAATGAGLELGDFVLRDQIDKEIYFEVPVDISIIGG
ncbi:MAG: type 4a pilus biogenesis protein PilO, partial [Kangiellaceae bacterium]|nr:type 4a pilus biogenesis protein PilO [Kangiellaceae bacterium]